jgi:hypothetical protein
MPRAAAPHPQPEEQCYHKMNQRTQQPWFWCARFPHPALGAMKVQRPDRGRSVGRAEHGSLEHIPGPMIPHRQPERSDGSGFAAARPGLATIALPCCAPVLACLYHFLSQSLSYKALP